MTPTQDMAVRVGQHVTLEGRVYHHYLAHWAEAWDVSRIDESPLERQGKQADHTIFPIIEVHYLRHAFNSPRSVRQGTSCSIQATDAHSVPAATYSHADTTPGTSFASWNGTFDSSSSKSSTQSISQPGRKYPTTAAAKTRC